MRAEVIALRLQKVCGQAVGGVAVEIAECRRHCRRGHTIRNCRGRDLAPRGNEFFHRALGAGLGVWDVVNLLEGYGQDNPGAKSQGVKQLMAGGGVILIGVNLVPLLSGLFG